MRLRWRRRRDLAERLRPYLPDRITPEPMVDADPIRMFLYRWMIETGDPIEVVAKGFDLDARLIDALVSGDIRSLPRQRLARIAARIGLDEADHGCSENCGLASAAPRSALTRPTLSS